MRTSVGAEHEFDVECLALYTTKQELVEVGVKRGVIGKLLCTVAS